MKIRGKALIIVLLLLSMPLASAVISNDADVASFCAETRDYCEAEVKDFAIKTDKVIQDSKAEVIAQVESDFRLFKMALVVLVVASSLLARILGDAIAFKRQEKHKVKPEGRRVVVVKGKWLFWLGCVLIVLATLYTAFNGVLF